MAGSESKQIDGTENGPENGGMKSGPSLIAGFHQLSEVRPSYWNAYKAESGATVLAVETLFN